MAYRRVACMQATVLTDRTLIVWLPWKHSDITHSLGHSKACIMTSTVMRQLQTCLNGLTFFDPVSSRNNLAL